MHSAIRISVVTATWNCVRTLPDCLDSMASQTYLHREHIVVDGASTDGTLDVLQQHRRQISALVSEPDAGIYDALNKGLMRATGDVVGFLHADDVYADDRVLEKIARVFQDPAVCAVYGDLEYVARNDPAWVIRRWQSKPFAPPDLQRGWMPPHPTLYVRREWYLKSGGFDTRYKIAADYLSILQFFSHSNFHTVYLPEVLVKMRTGGASNKSLGSIVKKSSEDWRALRSSGFGVFAAARALLWKNLGKVTQFLVR